MQKHTISNFQLTQVQAKSKRKCLHLSGFMDPTFPLQLATHLGHELHQLCNMEHDTNMKRAEFIDASVKIRQTFSFAYPTEILQAVQTHAGHWYGSMLWDFGGEKFGQILGLGPPV